MDRLFFGLGVSVLGIVTVFVGLIILIAFITILSKVTGSAASKKKNDPKPVKEKAAANNEIPGEVMAAITAALAAYDDAPSPDVVAAIAGALTVVMGATKFVVRHVKRIHNAPAWNRAGREEQIYSRF